MVKVPPAFVAVISHLAEDPPPATLAKLPSLAV